MKFGTHVEYIIANISGYRAIQVLPWKALAAILKMAAEHQFPLSKDFCNVDQTFLNQTYNFWVNDFKYATHDLLRHSNPPFLKMGATKYNVPISHELRYLER